jgi:hypothetical protein
MLASAEIDGFRFDGLEFHGPEFGSLVASVAERLVGAASAGAPEIGFVCFDGDGIRAILGHDRIWHDEGSLLRNRNFLIRNIRERERARERRSGTNRFAACISVQE